MTNEQISRFKNKRVLVMGLGLHSGGVGTVRFLLRNGARVVVTDLRSKKLLAPALTVLKKHTNISYVLGRHRKKDFKETDCVIKNPGVPPDSPYLDVARKHNIPIVSDVGIFFNLCPARIIGVTGSRGKSTTVHLIGKFLKAKFPRTLVGGNIRKSVLELLPVLTKKDWVVLELSSFQLYDMRLVKKSPHIAVLTTIFPDHLDWHKSLKNYIGAKEIIFKFQKADDYLFVNRGDMIVRKLIKKASSRLVQTALPSSLNSIVDNNLGKHYRGAVGLAVAVARHLKIPQRNIVRILKKFNGLEGRQEYLATIRGIHVVNDTTATTPEAVMAALERFCPLVKKGCKLILIAGGGDKNLFYRVLAQKIGKVVDNLILLPGSATNKLRRELRTKKPEMRKVSSMAEAVTTAYRVAGRGDWIILSPGATSFGLFANEFDRGEQFIKAIRAVH
jgi:UDP-N-acetylmuramoylalanine--D-glutamate ligase